jgi:hypothetical protein
LASRFYDDYRDDLVVTDLWHPRLEGHNLIKRIFKKRQVVGVISKTTVLEEDLAVPLLQKPFKTGGAIGLRQRNHWHSRTTIGPTLVVVVEAIGLSPAS